MAWSVKNKKMEIKLLSAHPPRANPAIQGRTPGTVMIRFTPQELFGAMARCSFLYSTNPAAVTHESEQCRYLIEQLVDDHADDFFIGTMVKQLKDHTRSNLVGVVGSGIAYLQMIRDGYVWCDHFENLALSGGAPTKKSPDYVFNRPGQTDVAITESKATHGSSRKKFARTVKSGYLDQVEPYLGFALGGAIASHGMSIGSWMTSATAAELLIDHTGPSGTSTPSKAPSSPAAVRRGNYLTVLTLMFGPQVAAAARAGEWPTFDTALPAVRWLDREWLLGFPTVPHERWIDQRLKSISETTRLLQSHSEFALELDVARAVFRSLTKLEGAGDTLDTLAPMDEALIGRAKENGGAVYPDGFAVIGKSLGLEEIDGLRWYPTEGAFLKMVPVFERLEGPAVALESAKNYVAEQLQLEPLRIEPRRTEALRLTLRNEE